MEKVLCTFHRKVDASGYISRYRALSEIPEKAVWKETIFTALGNDLPQKKNRTIKLYGEWKENVYKGKTSLQLDVQQYELLLPTNLTDIREILVKEVPGIGNIQADILLETLGSELFQTVKTAKSGQECGISDKNFVMLSAFIKREEQEERIFQLVADFKLSKGQAKRTVKIFGDDLMETLQENVYLLYQADVDLKLIDQINDTLEYKIEPTDRIRIIAAIATVLRKESYQNGHVYLLEDDLIDATKKILGYKIEEAYIVFALDACKSCDINYITWKDDKYYLTKLYDAEQIIVNQVIKRIHKKILDDPQVHELEERITENGKKEGFIPDTKQIEAVLMSQQQQLMILTGGPGTGKTWTLKLMIQEFERQNKSILMLAPTGNAAKRMKESTGFLNGGTIHHHLGYFIDDEFVARKKLSEDVIIVDENSMIDVLLFRDFISAVKPNATIILVGDKDQLEPIGPGKVFTDLIESNVIPTIVLDHIFRQGTHSMIASNARLINQGNPKAVWNQEDFVLVRIEGKNIDEQVKDMLIKVYCEQVKEHGVENIRILSPHKNEYNRGKRLQATSTDHINPMLDQATNPYHKGNSEIKSRKRLFHKNSFVIETSNQTKSKDAIVNGQVGFIKKIDAKKKEITVTYDDKDVVYKKNEIKTLDFANSITIHKAQGNEYPVVIIPLLTSYFKMLTRKLLYTATTRARQKVIFVGSLSAFYMAVYDNFSKVRNTTLKDRLKEGVRNDKQNELERIKRNTENTDVKRSEEFDEGPGFFDEMDDDESGSTSDASKE